MHASQQQVGVVFGIGSFAYQVEVRSGLCQFELQIYNR